MQEISLTKPCIKEEGLDISLFDLLQDIIFKKQLNLIDYLDTLLAGMDPSQEEITAPIKLKIYYIYYFLLDDKEKEYFRHIKFFLIEANRTYITNLYSSDLESLLDLDFFGTEEVLLNKLFLYIFKTYDDKLPIDKDIIKLTQKDKNNYLLLLNETFCEGYSQFQDDFLCAFCVGNSIFNYKEILSPYDYDKLLYCLNDLFYRIKEFPSEDNEFISEEQKFMEQAEDLFLKD